MHHRLSDGTRLHRYRPSTRRLRWTAEGPQGTSEQVSSCTKPAYLESQLESLWWHMLFQVLVWNCTRWCHLELGFWYSQLAVQKENKEHLSTCNILADVNLPILLWQDLLRTQEQSTRPQPGKHILSARKIIGYIIKNLNQQEIKQRKDSDTVQVDDNYYPSMWCEERVEKGSRVPRSHRCETINQDEWSILCLMIAGIKETFICQNKEDANSAHRNLLVNSNYDNMTI